MSSLNTLPAELLELIFKHLDNLDDVLHLERTCKLLHMFMETGQTRLQVFRSVILRADHHKHDIRLCRFIDANQAYMSCYVGRTQPDNRQRPQDSLFWHLCDGAQGALTDEDVWCIASRWQGLQIIKDLYRHPSVQAAYCGSITSTTVLDSSCNTASLSAAEPPLSPPAFSFWWSCGSQTDSEWSPQQTERLYRELTAHWLSIEALCLARVVTYSTETVQLQAFDRLRNIWSGAQESLSELLDRMEVYEFTWQFLTRRIFADIEKIDNWTDSDDLWFIAGNDNDDISERWDYTVTTIMSFLRPPNIIEMLLLSAWGDGSWPADKPDYLYQLGCADEIDGVVLVTQNGTEPDTYFGLEDLEGGMLQKAENISVGFRDQLKEYRRHWWANNARGRVLTWNENEDWIVEHFTGY